jgi:predicted ATPase
VQLLRDGGIRRDRLALADGELDAAQARALLAQAREQTDPAEAYALVGRARGLWRGAVLPDLGEVAPLAAWTVALDELRREVEDRHLAGAIEAGHASEAVGLAREAVAADPLREPAVRLLMRALAATGRGAEALREGYAYRRRLADEAGLDPTSALGTLERAIASSVGGAAGSGPVAGAAGGAGHRLVGRDADLAALRRLVEHERLVTVVGPGGVGKTSLALALARQLDEVAVLLLAPVTDPAAVPYALATALDLRAVRGDLLGACAAMLGAGPRVLVVDNCEHLRQAARDLVATLQARCPQLTVLATSRESLGLGTERQFRLAPLALPDPRATATAAQVPSVAVFLDRAVRARSGFVPGPAELRLVGDIVRRLDGMPLAIELAAGRLSSLGLTDLHDRLDRALDLLGDGRRPAGNDGVDARHRTLRTTIEWSYQLLAGPEQRLFRHLSVFPDGFDLATAEWVAADLGQQGDPAMTLARLVDASMIDADLDPRPRYRMLETLRAFGLDRLAATGEETEAYERLLRWAVTQAVWIGVSEPTERERDADAVLRRELPTLRTGWRLARRQGRLDDAFMLVAGVLPATLGRDLVEVWTWARELAADPATENHPRRAAVLGMAATAAWQRGELAEADRLAHRGLATSDGQDRWWCLSALAATELSRGGYADAITYSLQAAALAPHPNESYGVAALAATYAGHLGRARELNDRLAAVAASPTLRAFHAYVAGEVDNAAGRYEAAEDHYTRAIALARTTSATFIDGIAAVGLVTVRTAAGRTDEALRGYRNLIDYWERTGGWLQQWTTLRNLAHLLQTLGDPEPARFLEIAAEHAPDAPWLEASAASPSLPAGTETRIRREAVAATRAQVLERARQAIDRHLPAPTIA